MLTNNEIKQEIQRQVLQQVPELLIEPKIGAAVQILMQKGLDCFEDALKEKEERLIKELSKIEFNDQVETVDQKEWFKTLKENWKGCDITIDDGTGNTYGELGDIVAHVGPDMQSDVRAIWCTNDKWGWVVPRR